MELQTARNLVQLYVVYSSLSTLNMMRCSYKLHKIDMKKISPYERFAMKVGII
ncbi:hypothetical protein Cri9333_3693 [Crinalium epipsammum PCC 9333]|uniref:Uncharacterized protein n=1 Tax=Crinalium epipsammum PCC 9333 TaxID=1173022 RepID=K9W2Q7_9CYAN|nr:hypothetical protein Cri9333_3693 [Crinalium epipsammum PCC 9333]